MKILICPGIICNFINVQSQTFQILKQKDNFRILTNLKTNLKLFFDYVEKFIENWKNKILKIF